MTEPRIFYATKAIVFHENIETGRLWNDITYLPDQDGNLLVYSYDQLVATIYIDQETLTLHVEKQDDILRDLFDLPPIEAPNFPLDLLNDNK